MFLDRSLGDIAVFRFCPNITDVSLFRTQVSGKAHSLRFLLLPVFVSALLKCALGDIAVFANHKDLESLELASTEVSGESRSRSFLE